MAARQAFVLAVAGILLFGGLWAVSAQQQAAVTASGDFSGLTDEINTTNASGERFYFAQSNQSDVVYVDDNNVTVTQDNTTFSASGNYSWAAANGSIRLNSSTGLDTGAGASNATVEWGLFTPTDRQQWLTDVSSFVYSQGNLILLAIVAGTLMGALMLARRAGT